MTFNSIDAYEAYIEQVNEQQYEEMMMKADDIEEFNKLMKEWDGEIAAQEGIRKRDDGLFERLTAKPEVIGVRKNNGKLEPVYAGDFKRKEKQNEAIKAPSHYDFIDTTVEKLIEKAFTHEELMGWLKGNVIKYRMRAFKKGDKGMQDIAKADEYQKFYDEYKERNTPR